MTEPGSADDVRTLLGAYAVDAVDADERAAVEALVAADPAAAQRAGRAHRRRRDPR